MKDLKHDLSAFAKTEGSILVGKNPNSWNSYGRYIPPAKVYTLD